MTSRKTSVTLKPYGCNGVRACSHTHRAHTDNDTHTDYTHTHTRHLHTHTHTDTHTHTHTLTLIHTDSTYTHTDTHTHTHTHTRVTDTTLTDSMMWTEAVSVPCRLPRRLVTTLSGAGVAAAGGVTETCAESLVAQIKSTHSRKPS